MLVTQENLILASEIVGAAKAGTGLAEFESDSRLMPVLAGRGHQDRMHMMRLLVEQGAVSVRSGKLTLGQFQVPEWLATASNLGFKRAQELADEFLPTDEARKKFDEALLTRIGLEGEQALVEMILSAIPQAKVRHVSLFDDTLGYDLVVEIEDSPPIYIEVKTSVRADKGVFTLFLSRNEELKSRTLKGWQLACVSISEGIATYRGEMDLSRLRNEIPANSSQRVQWQTLRIQESIDDLEIKVPFSSLAPILVSSNAFG